MDRKKIFSVPGLLLVIAAFLILNAAAGPLLKSARLDLTEENIHTLSEGTLNILNNLEEPLTLKFFWSRSAAQDLPGLILYARGVQEMLEEYQARSGGKIVLEVIDPEPFSEEEDEAVALGLNGVPVSGGLNTLYFGLAGKDLEGKDLIIPFFQPEREMFLENDISQMVYTLSHPEKITVGLMSALPVTGGPSPANPFQTMPPWMISDVLHRHFNLKVLAQEEPVPEDVDILLLVHPHGLSDTALYFADQFVLGKGRALVLADPFSESTGRPTLGGEGQDHPADRLLAAWGASMEPMKVVGDLEISRMVSFRGRLGFQTTNYLPWITVSDELIDREEVVTSQLRQVNMGSAGSLLQSDGSSTDFIPLLFSTRQSMLIPVVDVAFNPDPARLMSLFSPSGISFTLGARLRGPALTAFPDGPPPLPEGNEDGTEKPVYPEHIRSSEGDINVIIIADTDMLQDGFWVDIKEFFGQRIPIPLADNADLIVNAIDHLGGSQDLIGLRSRGTAFRPFTLLDRVAKEAEFKFRTVEQELIDRLDETENRLSDLQARREDPNSPELTPEQQKELEKFLEEKVRIRRELREVQFRLRHDIERLQSMIRFVNIGLVPLTIALLALGIWFFRRRKDRKSIH
jgi:ABC-type uncharacterized transport system involved in gliding motility auxiliary subunit